MHNGRNRVILSWMPDAVACALEPYRRELTGHCRRVLGSTFEAEDAVQETMVRAWRRIDGFEGRASLRSWLRRIATNVCFDMLRRPQRRARPFADVEPPPAESDPADVAESREAVRLAFAAAVAHLPARQRAVLILREVLGWRASEVAELLDTSVASVDSALQRARARLGDCDRDAHRAPLEERQRALLSRYTSSFERHDVGALVSLLRDDARTGTRGQPSGDAPLVFPVEACADGSSGAAQRVDGVDRPDARTVHRRVTMAGERERRGARQERVGS
jgi:RNA polymerase sigma-70 factor (ECF subfamily)